MLGRRIKKQRKKNDLTQKELAVLLDVSKSSIASYEVGRRKPNLTTLENMADLLDVSVDYLLGRDEAS